MGQRRIPEKETLEVEFKSDLKRLPDAELIDTVVALSNTNGGELYVKGMNISTYFWASKWGSHEPARDRKLLLTKRELRHLEQATKTKGLTIVAVRAYIAENGFAKLHIALARGKKEYDKRATIREKDIRREMERS